MGTIAELAELITCHDLTHEMSDDPKWYRAGRRELHEIEELAKYVPVSVYHALWNDKVLRSVQYNYCYMFLKGGVRKEHEWRKKNETDNT